MFPDIYSFFLIFFLGSRGFGFVVLGDVFGAVGQCGKGEGKDSWVGGDWKIHIHIYYWVDCGYRPFPLSDALLRLDLFVG